MDNPRQLNNEPKDNDSTELLRRIEQLEKKVSSLESELRSVLPVAQPIQEFPHISSLPQTPPPLPPTPPKQAKEVMPSQQPYRPPILRSSTAEPFVERAKPRESNHWEKIIGGNLLNRLGILAILIGVGFFLKLASDKGWIGPELRVALGVIVGLGMIVSGEVLQRKGYAKFSAGLSGGGIGILYFTTYAAYKFYHFIPPDAAFVCACAVTAIGVFLSLRTRVMALAVLAQIGGFLTPLFINSGVDKQLELFTYILLLDVGMLAVAFLREWRVLERIGWFATTILFWGWANTYYNEEKFALTFFFLTLFYLLFYLTPIARVSFRKTSASTWDLFAIIALSSGYFGAAVIFLEPQHENWIEYLGLGLAALQAASGWYLQKKKDPSEEDSKAAALAYGLSGLFFTFFLWKAFEGPKLTCFLALWAGFLTWLWLRKNHWAMQIAWVAIHFWVIVRLIVFHAGLEGNYTPFWNPRILTFSAAALAWLSTFAFAVWYSRDGTISVNPTNADIPYFVGSILLISALGCEIAGIVSPAIGNYPWGHYILNRLGPDATPFANSRFALLLFAAIGFLMASRVGMRFLAEEEFHAPKSLSIFAMIFGVMAICPEIGGLLSQSIESNPRAYFALQLELPVNEYAWLWNGRTLFLLSYASFLIFLSCIAEKLGRVSLPNPLQVLTKMLGGFLLFLWLSAEAMGIADAGAGRDPWSGIFSDHFRTTGVQTSLTLCWVLIALTLIAVGVMKKQASLRYFALALFGVTALKVLFVDLSHLEQIWRVLSFIGMGIIFVAASWLYHKFLIGPEKIAETPEEITPDPEDPHR